MEYFSSGRWNQTLQNQNCLRRNSGKINEPNTFKLCVYSGGKALLLCNRYTSVFINKRTVEYHLSIVRGVAITSLLGPSICGYARWRYASRNKPLVD